MQDLYLFHMNVSLKNQSNDLFHVFTRIRGNLCGMLYSTSPYKADAVKNEFRIKHKCGN